MMEIEFSAIPPDQILLIWKKVVPLFEKLIEEQGTGSLEEYFRRIAVDKTHLLWVTWEKDNFENILMVLMTRVNGKILDVSCCAGVDLADWTDGYLATCRTLEEFGRDMGCTRSRIQSGRKGWSKLLAKIDMKITGYTYEKEL